jgi:hypothetical protein
MSEEDSEIQVKVFQKKFCIGEILISILPFKRFELTRSDKWYKIKSTSHIEAEGEIHMSIKVSVADTDRRKSLLRNPWRDSKQALLYDACATLSLCRCAN